MPLLELKNIGKIYTSNSNAAVGLRGVNLSFECGEIVAVTGKSGSGKSTLLNVISGMDDYEEGEMYIEGQPTSHYRQSDWEEYREKYISFIFQDYNIIDSFTVLENVELALMHIDDKHERRKRALELLKRVGMTPYIAQKGSQLSGGQKQRTVIARALAKDSPIILADEPTGNLDSATSKEIIELLHDVSKNKLLIVVTHNFEQMEQIATRHIRIFDGAIESDNVLLPHFSDVQEEKTETVRKKSKKDEFKKGFTLGRAIYKSKPKLTVFLCFLMILGTLGAFAATSSCGESIKELFEPTLMFTHIDGRVVLAKKNGEPITDEELENLKSEYGAVDSLHYDILLDNENGNDFLFYYSAGTPSKNSVALPSGDDYVLEDFQCTYTGNFGANIIGRYPSEKNEVFLYLPISYQTSFGKKSLTANTVYMNGLQMTVTGVKYYYDNNKTPVCILTRDGFEEMTAVYYLYSADNMKLNVTVEENGLMKVTEYAKFVPSYAVEDGKACVLNRDVTNNIGSATIEISAYYDEYYNDSVKSTKFELTVDSENLTDVYPSVSNPTVINSYGDSSSYYSDTSVVISPSLLRNTVQQTLADSYSQASLFFENDKQAQSAAEKINGMEYIAVLSNETYNADSASAVFGTLGGIMSLLVWLGIIVFLAYFINLCSARAIDAFKADMAIMRSMGINVLTIKIGMYVRMMLTLIPALLLTCLSAIVIFSTPQLNGKFTYLYFWQYCAIFVGMIIMTLRITRKQIKRLFGQSVKKALRGGNAE